MLLCSTIRGSSILSSNIAPTPPLRLPFQVTELLTFSLYSLDLGELIPTELFKFVKSDYQRARGVKDEDEPSLRPILDPARDESSIAEQTPEPSTAPFALTFKVIEDSTSKGRPKLIDSRGYCYGVKRRRVNATDWICTRRPKVNIISFAFN